MSLESDLKALSAGIEFYADADNWTDNHQMPSISLFGVTYDDGEKARSLLPVLRRVQERVEKLQLAIKESQQESKRVTAWIPTDSHIDLWMRTWVCVNRVPLLAQAYQGYVKHGLGVVLVMHWWKQGSSAEFKQRSFYMVKDAVPCQIPEPWQSQLLEQLPKIDPLKQALLIFGGHDLSAKGGFSSDRNYFRIEVIEAGEGESMQGFADELGLIKSVPEHAIEVEQP